MSTDWIKRASSFSGLRSEIPADFSPIKAHIKFRTFSFLNKRKKSRASQLSTDSTLINDSADLDMIFQSNDSSTLYNPFSSVADYRKAAQQSQDQKFRFQYVQFLIQAAYETSSKFFIDEARQWLEILANPLLFNKVGDGETQKGFVLAQYILANWYMSGSYGIKVDQKKAFELYQMAASQDHASSLYLLAKCYQDGIGVEQNHEQARRAYEKASLLGDARASYILGHAYIYGGIGVETNPLSFLKGIELLKTCANDPSGDFFKDALYELSVLHSGSKNTKSRLTDPVYSLSCLARAANLDHDLAQYRLGYNYEHGLLNLPINPNRSIFWYSRAAALDNAEACLALSGWYLTGAEGVLPKSIPDAFLWARKSADKGSARGHYAVGYFYEKGLGVRQNKKEANRWYRRSASMGDKKAIARLDELSRGKLFRKSSMNPHQQPDLLSVLAAASAAQPNLPTSNSQVNQPIDLVALFDDQPAQAPPVPVPAPVVQPAPTAQQNPIEILAHLCSQLPPEDHPLLKNLYRQVMEKKIPKQMFLQKTKELFAKKKMQALGMSSVPSKRFTSADPSANKRPKMEKSFNNPYLDDAGRGQLPDWAANNKAFPTNPAARPLISAGQSSIVSNHSSRPSSAGSSINVSQEIDLELEPVSQKGGKKDADSSKMDVDSMMDATAYGGVDLKEEEFSFNMPAYGQQSASSKETPFLNVNRLKKEVQSLVSSFGISNVDSRILSLISQAAEIRIHKLVSEMVKTSQHRTGILTSEILKQERDSNSEYVLELVVSADKSLETLEAEEKEMESHLKSDVRSQSEELAAPQKSKKQDIPESAKTKMINSTALRAAGGTMKSWMLPANEGSGSGVMLKTGFPVQKKNSSGKRKENAAKGKLEDPALKGMRITQKDRITLKDAVLVVERDPILSKSSIYYKWLSNLR